MPPDLINHGDAEAARWVQEPFAQTRLQVNLMARSVSMAHFYMYVMRSIAYTAWEGIVAKRAF